MGISAGVGGIRSTLAHAKSWPMEASHESQQQHSPAWGPSWRGFGQTGPCCHRGYCGPNHQLNQAINSVRSFHYVPKTSPLMLTAPPNAGSVVSILQRRKLRHREISPQKIASSDAQKMDTVTPSGTSSCAWGLLTVALSPSFVLLKM